MTMSYSEYVFSEQFQKDLESDEDFIVEVVEIVRENFNRGYPDKQRIIGTMIMAETGDLYEVYEDESGAEDGAEGESNEIDRQNVIEIRGMS